MSNSSGGKGSAPRPYSVDSKTFADNFNRIFGEKPKTPSTPVTTGKPS